MSKKPIDINKLSSDLSQSSAFFKKSSPPPQRQEPAQQAPTPAEMPPPPVEPLVATMQPTNQATMVTTLEFGDGDINELKSTAHVSQTYRFTESELALLRDMVYQINKELDRGKVAQVDILRMALKLFVKCFTGNQAAVLSLVKRIK